MKNSGSFSLPLLSNKIKNGSPRKTHKEKGRLTVSFFLIILTAAILMTSFSPLSGRRFSQAGRVSADTENIATFSAADCSTPKSSWNLGESVCAVATGASADRRIAWVAPNGAIAQVSNDFTGANSDTYSIPTGSDPFAQVGTWNVETIDASGVGFAVASFVVRDPANASVDLAINKFGPFDTSAGANISYRIEITNNGPDDAQNIVLTDDVPGGTTFVTEVQESGPAFTCTTPTSGGTGTITCTGATLPANNTAIFTIVVAVNGDAAGGSVITNTASVTSATNEIEPSNNTASSSATVSGTATSTCSISCPGDITVNNDPDQCNAVVSYSTPTASGDCTDPETGESSPVVCSPPAGSPFPIGTTVVTCATGGNFCSFNVTVHDTRPPVQPTINCPANVTVDEEAPGSGSATVNYASPTTTGNCVTAACDPPSGAAFPIGTTTVTCTATDSAKNSVTCSFTVTVHSTAGCTITCPGDVSQAADANQCSAIVNYAEPTTSGNCGSVSCTPASGSTFPVGTTSVTCTSSQGGSCSFNVTVTSAAPTITTCAANKTLSANGSCEAEIPDLSSEVVTTGCSVAISQSPAAGTMVGVGVTTVTITASNSAGQATCTATVTVVDNTAPVITNCPAASSASAGIGCQAAVPNVISMVVATDNCTPSGSLTITQSPAAGTPAGLGVTTITVTVRDQAGNTSTCTTTFTVNDTTPPTALCRNITIALDASGSASITAAQIDNGSSDNCGIASITVTPSTFTCANKGANAVTLTVRDASNNSASCTATVTVIDNIPPTIVCSPDISVAYNPSVSGAVVTFATPVAVDNCPGATITQTTGLPSGSTFPLGTTVNTFVVTDTSGLTATCSFKVTVALTSILSLDSFSMTGGGLIDSYDSTGGYPATKGSQASLVSNGTISFSGGSQMFGDLRSTRAGVSLVGGVRINGNAAAGTTVSITGGSTVSGTITNNQMVPSVTPPAVVACGPPYSPNSGISGGYSYSSSTGNLTLSGGNIATLANGTYCFHNINLSNGAQLRVNGPVVIKITGTLNASGGSITNATTIPGNLQILSSYTGSNGVVLNNGSSAYLVIYAPQTSVSLSGGVVVFGNIVGKSLTLSNSATIHYDTRLVGIWPNVWSLASGQ